VTAPNFVFEAFLVLYTKFPSKTLIVIPSRSHWYMTTRTVDERIDRLARPQHGLVGLAQVVGSGITPDQLRARLDRGSLVRLDAGVYRTMGARQTWEQALLAACLAAGPEALVSHRAAAVLWGLIDPPAPVEIVVPYEQCPTPAAALLHRSTDLRHVDAARRRGIPVTNPIRTVGDLGAVAPQLVPGAIERGLYLDRFSVDALWLLVKDRSRPGRRGLGVLHRALRRRALGGVKAHSPLESTFAAIALTTGVGVEYQYEVELDGHRYVLDFAVPAVKVGVEVDGLETRATRESLDHCDERQNRLVLDGWHLLRYTSTHLRQRRAAIRRELTGLVESRLHGL
jgi:very-short-patch-repair endonuclease